MIALWIWHVVAGVVGVIISLSSFYQFLERKFSVHRPLTTQEITRIVNEHGEELPQETWSSFVDHYNGLIFMGRTPYIETRLMDRFTLFLHSGEKWVWTFGDPYHEVRRVFTSGKMKCFVLYQKP